MKCVSARATDVMERKPLKQTNAMKLTEKMKSMKLMEHLEPRELPSSLAWQPLSFSLRSLVSSSFDKTNKELATQRMSKTKKLIDYC